MLGLLQRGNAEQERHLLWIGLRILRRVRDGGLHRQQRGHGKDRMSRSCGAARFDLSWHDGAGSYESPEERPQCVCVD